MRVSPKASFREVLTDARRRGFAAGWFNVNGLEYLQAIVEVAKQERSTVILGVSEGVMKYVGLDYTVALANAAQMKATVPVILHLEHGPNFELVMECVRHGFDAVMVDGSHDPLAENIARTKQVVEVCHTAGVNVEGELGRIGVAQDELNVDERDATLARPDEDIQQAIRESQSDFTRVVRQSLENPKVFDPRKDLGPAGAAMKETIRAKIRLFRSIGRYHICRLEAASNAA